MSIGKTIKSKPALLFMALFALFLVYLFFLANEKYRSESTYVIRDLSTKESLGVDFGLFGQGASSQTQDANIVMTYLQSMDVLRKVDDRFSLREQYGSSRTELLERLLWFSSEEDFLKLYRKNLHITPDEVSGLTHVSFDSIDPQMSHDMLQFLLEIGEAFLNKLNHQRAEDKIAFIAEQRETNRRQLDSTIDSLEAFQNRNKVVDPLADVATLNKITADLESEIIIKTAEYNQLTSYRSANSIEALKLKKGIQELRSALSKTKDRLAGNDQKLLNDLVFEYQKLKSDVDFATEVYKSTLVQYENYKIEALQDSKIFQVIATPNLPDGHVYPMRFNLALTALLLAIVGYKIAMLIWTVVQDHKD